MAKAAPAQAKALVQDNVRAAVADKPTGHPATANDIAPLASRVFHLLITTWESRRARRPHNDPDFNPYYLGVLDADEDELPTETEGQRHTYFRMMEWLDFLDKNDGRAIKPVLGRAARELGLVLDEEADFYPDLVRAVLTAAHRAAVIDNDREHSIYTPEQTAGYAPALHFSSPFPAAPIAPTSSAPAAPWPSLIENFFKDRPSIGPKARVSHQQAFKELAALTGAIPIRSVTAEQITGFADFLRDKKNSRGGATQLSHATIVKLLQHVKSFFAWATKKYNLPSDPAEKATPRTKTPEERAEVDSRRPFKREELIKLFDSPLLKGCASMSRRAKSGPNKYRDEKFWFLLVAHLTGGRTEEIAKLPSALIERDGIVFLDFLESGTKTPAAPRLVPVLPELKRIGFLEWVAEKVARGDKHLFKGGEAVDDWSKFSNNYLDSIGLTGFDISAYSLRHNFMQMLRAAQLADDFVKLVFGHKGVMYGKEPSIDEYRGMIERVRPLVPLDHLIPTKQLP